MRIDNLRRYLFLLSNFRNGWQLVNAYRQDLPCGEAVLRSGERLIHPPDRGGFVGTILELWLDECYTPEGFYQPADGDVVLDVGAHVGLFSLWVVRRNPHVRVVAVEPSAENFPCLQANLISLGADQVEAHQCALGSGGGRGRVEAATQRSIDHRLVASEEEGAVPILSLREVVDLAGAPRIAFLKMDVEGGEYDAFAGADTDLLERIDRLAMEYHDHLRPGTLDLIRDRLGPSHELTVLPIEDRSYGTLLAVRRV